MFVSVLTNHFLLAFCAQGPHKTSELGLLFSVCLNNLRGGITLGWKGCSRVWEMWHNFQIHDILHSQATSSCQRQWWVVVGALPLLPKECNHFRTDTPHLISWIWGTVSMFALSEHTFTWPPFPALLRWIVQSYLCAWCTAMSLHPSCLKASPPHPDTIAVAWLFSQPLSLLLIFIRRLFLQSLSHLLFFISVHLSEMSCTRRGGWITWLWLKKKKKKAAYLCNYLPADAPITLKADCEEKKGLWHKVNKQWTPKRWHSHLEWTTLRDAHRNG